jgi:uncharacterized protein (TIGR02145 family)
MKKILIGFIAIGLLTFVGCEIEEDLQQVGTPYQSSDTTDSSETSSDDGTSDDSSIQYGEGVTDIDGNTYKSVIIGEQEWMAENLRTSKYSDGTSIPNVTGNTEWEGLTTGARSHYDNDNQYEATYGKLYNWYSVNTGRLAPEGWHVPTDAEWTVLTDYLEANGHEETEGTALKARSSWRGDPWDASQDDISGSGNGSDHYGWNGLPGGQRQDGGYFSFSWSEGGYWWSSLEFSEGSAWSRSLSNFSDSVSRGYSVKSYGFSIRCLRD